MKRLISRPNWIVASGRQLKISLIKRIMKWFGIIRMCRQKCRRHGKRNECAWGGIQANKIEIEWQRYEFFTFLTQENCNDITNCQCASSWKFFGSVGIVINTRGSCKRKCRSDSECEFFASCCCICTQSARHTKITKRTRRRSFRTQQTNAR